MDRYKYSEDEALQRLQLIEYAINLVKQNDATAKSVFQKAHNRKMKEKSFDVNDHVLVHFPQGTNLPPGANKKFVNTWREVLENLSTLSNTGLL